MLKIVWWTLVLLAILTFTDGQNQKAALISEDEMQIFLAEYNSKASEFSHRTTEAAWKVATDVGNQTKVNEKVRLSLLNIFGNLIYFNVA